MPRDPWQRVGDMIAACREILDFTAGMDFKAFQGDTKTVRAVTADIQIIGEAAKNVTDDITALAPGLPWQDIRDMRDVIAHEYHRVDAWIVWLTVTEDIPDLLAALEAIAPDD